MNRYHLKVIKLYIYIYIYVKLTRWKNLNTPENIQQLKNRRGYVQPVEYFLPVTRFILFSVKFFFFFLQSQIKTFILAIYYKGRLCIQGMQLNTLHSPTHAYEKIKTFFSNSSIARNVIYTCIIYSTIFF